MVIIRKTNEPMIHLHFTITLMFEHMYACGCVWENTPVDLFIHTLNVPVYVSALRLA